MSWVLLLAVSATAALAQVVMKYAAQASNEAGTFFDAKVVATVAASFAISCVGQLLWFYVLRFASLSTSYLFLSLVFVMVPLAGAWLFSEILQPLHFVSMALILSGVVVLGCAGAGK